MKTKMLSLARCAMVLSFLVVAAPLGAAWSAAPRSVIEEATERMIVAISDERSVIDEQPWRVEELATEILAPHFDFQRISARVLGKNWHKADETQRQRFIEEFRSLLVRTYSAALWGYYDQKINYLPVRESATGKTVIVRTEILQDGGQPIPINYAMYADGADWKIYDVSVEGVSLVINYRSSFTAIVRKVGLDGLIDKLALRNQTAFVD
jgi:phospholipid transport system substrate-binding protein